MKKRALAIVWKMIQIVTSESNICDVQVVSETRTNELFHNLNHKHHQYEEKLVADVRPTTAANAFKSDPGFVSTFTGVSPYDKRSKHWKN